MGTTQMFSSSNQDDSDDYNNSSNNSNDNKRTETGTKMTEAQRIEVRAVPVPVTGREQGGTNEDHQQQKQVTASSALLRSFYRLPTT